jgi:hypothetical protein
MKVKSLSPRSNTHWSPGSTLGRIWKNRNDPDPFVDPCPVNRMPIWQNNDYTYGAACDRRQRLSESARPARWKPAI